MDTVTTCHISRNRASEFLRPAVRGVAGGLAGRGPGAEYFSGAAGGGQGSALQGLADRFLGEIGQVQYGSGVADFQSKMGLAAGAVSPSEGVAPLRGGAGKPFEG